MRPHCLFQFTHPGKGATVTSGFRGWKVNVSIHAPWEGCDARRADQGPGDNAVSIHAPWEGCDSLDLEHP